MKGIKMNPNLILFIAAVALFIYTTAKLNKGSDDTIETLKATVNSQESQITLLKKAIDQNKADLGDLTRDTQKTALAFQAIGQQVEEIAKTVNHLAFKKQPKNINFTMTKPVMVEFVPKFDHVPPPKTTAKKPIRKPMTQ